MGNPARKGLVSKTLKVSVLSDQTSLAFSLDHTIKPAPVRGVRRMGVGGWGVAVEGGWRGGVRGKGAEG